jgi:hypothetical protein
MVATNQKYWHAVQVKNYMKKNGNYYIRNSERVRKQLEMNKRQLSHAIQYLKKIGFLEPWNNRIYKIKHNIKENQ